MEATKLHTVLIDITNEEASFGFDKAITDLISQIQANQSEGITNAMSFLEENLSLSIFNKYPISNYKILAEINGTTFVGKLALEKLKNILNQNAFNIAKIIAELQEFQKKRNEFITTVGELESSFEKLHIGAHFYDDDTYEIGILFPERENENKITHITKELTKWDNLCKSFQELVGVDVSGTEITLVNNGSLEFFSTNTAHVAVCISFAIERVCTLYKRILEIRETREKLKTLGVPKSEEEAVKKHEKEIYSKEIDAITTDLLKQFAAKKIEEGRLNELKVAVKGHLNYIAKTVDKGLVIEIIPPEIDEPEILSIEETEDNKKEKKQTEKEYREKLEKIEMVKKSTELAKEIALTGKEVFKFLASGESEEEEEKKESKK